MITTTAVTTSNKIALTISRLLILRISLLLPDHSTWFEDKSFMAVLGTMTGEIYGKGKPGH